MKDSDPFTILENTIFTALESYSNVHRGSGHKSKLSTQLFEQARKIILHHSGKNPHKYVVIFTTPSGADRLVNQINDKNLIILSSSELGLPVGVRALVVRRNSLPKGSPVRSGGGTAKLISRDWIIWESAPAKFEPGTPAVINIIAFVRALQLADKNGSNCFREVERPVLNVKELLYRDEFGQYHGKELLERIRETRIGRNLLVPTLNGQMTSINLDNSASTPTFSPIWEVYRKTLLQPEVVRKEIVGEVKSICAGFLGFSQENYEVIFTSNTTESINLVAENMVTPDEQFEPVIVSSLLEHSSNDLPWRFIDGITLVRLSVDPDGFFDLAGLEKLLGEYNRDEKYGNKRIKMVALSGASNVLGTCNNLAAIGQLTRRFGAGFLVDGAQLVAHRKIEMESSGIDFLAFSAHKAYAPFGCGVLVARKDWIREVSRQQEMIRGSEENAAGIAALGKALYLLGRIGMNVVEREEQELTADALKRLSGFKEVQLYGIKDPGSSEFTRKLGVISFTFKNMVSFRIGKELSDRKGIGIRVGCHCAHITVKHILNVGPGLEKFQRIMQTLIPVMSFPGVARVSLGLENRREDLDRLVEGLSEILPRKGKNLTISQSELREQLNSFYISRIEKVYGEF